MISNPALIFMPRERGGASVSTQSQFDLRLTHVAASRGMYKQRKLQGVSD